MMMFSSLASSQNPLKKLKNVVGGNKSQLLKAGSKMLSEMDKARAEFDSTDFDYAILLSDNSGLFDVKENGEMSAKISTINNIQKAYKENGIKTAMTDNETNARANL
jgi:hypothetical protein